MRKEPISISTTTSTYLPAHQGVSMDSGTTAHMTGDLALHHCIIPCKRGVRLANDHAIPIDKMGDLRMISKDTKWRSWAASASAVSDNSSARAKKCLCLDYNETKKAYKVYDLEEKKIVFTLDCRVEETEFLQLRALPTTNEIRQ
ncbi:hypothetical protein DYB37_010549 [Aphanomyces astaci]|uniref:Retroviral polymerase SH3-like domain-containing protein n=1 Tax=Aphanomyces astaci TaxID=112090 RepID=A0A3R7BUM2_APHAT|nr:hypothetical protein DYB35_001352 [Aphanomyces astaci]RHZ23885.1 hypothetical protein DYB37_010549 [Aphanomyces astaci]